MPYLGRELTSGNYLKLDDISSQFNGSTTTFQLKSGGSDFFPGSSFSLLVSVAGVIQEADSAYQINNNEITFATAPSNSDDAFIIVLGLALGVGVPADGTVGLTQLNDTAKLGISTSNSNNTSTVSVGGGVTSINFAGPGVTTAFVTPSTGIATIFFQGGGGGVGAAGTWAVDAVGVSTSKVVGIATTARAEYSLYVGKGPTAGSGTTTVVAYFDGDISVAGTIFKENVVNLDSIGFVTARSGINVGYDYDDGTGVGATILPSGNAVFAGVVTASTMFYPPVITTTVRDATSVNTGALIFNTTTGQLEIYNGSSWVGVGALNNLTITNL